MSGIVSKVLKTLVFPVFWGFSGVAHCCSSGFGRFRCFCVSCVCFFCLAFVSVLFALFLALWLDVVVLLFGVFLLPCGWIVVIVLFLFGGFKGQVRWPKGPPHLAPNPPYFICFVFFVFCFSLFFCFFVVFLFVLLEGLRVR